MNPYFELPETVQPESLVAIDCEVYDEDIDGVRHLATAVITDALVNVGRNNLYALDSFEFLTDPNRLHFWLELLNLDPDKMIDAIQKLIMNIDPRKLNGEFDTNRI